MFDLFIQNISQTIDLSDADIEVFRANLLSKKLKKRQFFVQEGNNSSYTAYVTQGCLRTYTIDSYGVEHVFQFAIEGWWVSDMYSFLTGEPAQYNIEALEDCELLLMDKEGSENIMNLVPKFERFMRLLLEKNYVATQRRVNALLGNSAEQRYLTFIKTYPKIVQRVPQHMIASYLGITPETLSRIRKQLKGY